MRVERDPGREEVFDARPDGWTQKTREQEKAMGQVKYVGTIPCPFISLIKPIPKLALVLVKGPLFILN